MLATYSLHIKNALLCFLFCLLLAPSAGIAQDVTELSLEELMNIEVTSAAKKKQKLSDVAAAIFVITADDIRRSGSTTIADLLRMVPGVQVAQVDSSKWAISSRGFNGVFANKLLVLIDGRSVYTPLFSGVYWDVQDVPLEDIERIEVIRGPGATLWGTNAVNGVINIITLTAEETQGTLLSAGAGSHEKAFGTARQGAAIPKGHLRLYAKYNDREDFDLPSGQNAQDDWQVRRAGFRGDWTRPERGSLTVQGDIYTGRAGANYRFHNTTPPFDELVHDTTEIAGGNLLARWGKTFSETARASLQLYYDRTERDDAFFREHRNTYDLDFQHQFSAGASHSVVWGLGYRLTRDDIRSSFMAEISPERSSHYRANLFIQDEITLSPDTFKLTIGTKFEYNEYTGVEIQPNLRMAWTPTPRQSLWASVSRAVRTPSRAEDSGRIVSTLIPPASPAELPNLVVYSGNSDIESEDLYAYELGYRLQVLENFTIDAAAFYNQYRHLRTAPPESVELSPPPPALPTYVTTNLAIRNDLEASSYGAEISADWAATSDWLLKTAYTFIHEDRTIEWDSPRHQLSLRSTYAVTSRTELNLWLRYVDRVSEIDIDSYLTLDAMMSWRPQANLELSLVGRNLLDRKHIETRPQFTVLPAEIERSVYGKITWSF